MPAPFVPVSIPLTSGLRQDLATFSPGAPEQLSEATNVVFTKQGAIKGRAGQQTRDAALQSSRVSGTTLDDVPDT